MLTIPCCLERNLTRWADPDPQRELDQLARLQGGGQADAERKCYAVRTGGAKPADERAGVEAELADHVVRVALLALKRSLQGVVTDARMAFGIATHADPLWPEGTVHDRLEQVACIAVRSSRLLGVSANHIQVGDPGRADPVEERCELIGAMHLAGSKVRDDPMPGASRRLGMLEGALQPELR